MKNLTKIIILVWILWIYWNIFAWDSKANIEISKIEQTFKDKKINEIVQVKQWSFLYDEYIKKMNQVTNESDYNYYRELKDLSFSKLQSFKNNYSIIDYDRKMFSTNIIWDVSYWNYYKKWNVNLKNIIKSIKTDPNTKTRYLDFNSLQTWYWWENFVNYLNKNVWLDLVYLQKYYNDFWDGKIKTMSNFYEIYNPQKTWKDIWVVFVREFAKIFGTSNYLELWKSKNIIQRELLNNAKDYIIVFIKWEKWSFDDRDKWYIVSKKNILFEKQVENDNEFVKRVEQNYTIKENEYVRVNITNPWTSDTKNIKWFRYEFNVIYKDWMYYFLNWEYGYSNYFANSLENKEMRKYSSTILARNDTKNIWNLNNMIVYKMATNFYPYSWKNVSSNTSYKKWDLTHFYFWNPVPMISKYEIKKYWIKDETSFVDLLWMAFLTLSTSSIDSKIFYQYNFWEKYRLGYLSTLDNINKIALENIKWFSSDQEKMKSIYNWMLKQKYTHQWNWVINSISSWFDVFTWKQWVCWWFANLLGLLYSLWWINWEIKIESWYAEDWYWLMSTLKWLYNSQETHAWIQVWEWRYDITFDLWANMDNRLLISEYFNFNLDSYNRPYFWYKMLENLKRNDSK